MKLLSCETCKFHDAGRCRRYAPGRGGQEAKSAPQAAMTRQQRDYELEKAKAYMRMAAYGAAGGALTAPGPYTWEPDTAQASNPWPRVQADDWCGDWDA